MHTMINKVGFCSGILAFAFAMGYCIIQIFQLAGVISFPMDEYLIYGSALGIAIPFLLAMLALHYITASDKKIWSHAALLFSTIYVVFVVANYVVQLAAVVPAKQDGSIDAIRILDQTPHSLFWNFDALGYIFMGIASLSVVPVFEKHGFQKWTRLAFLCNALVTPLIAIVYFYRPYSEKLLLLGFPWAVTAPASMLLLALLFRKKQKVNSLSKSHDNNQSGD